MKFFDSIKKKAKRTYKQLKKRLSKKKNQRKLMAFTGLVLIGSVSSALLINNAKDNRQKLQLQHQVELKQHDTEVKAKEVEQTKLQEQKVMEQKQQVEQQKADIDKQLNDSKNKIQDLEIQLQAKKQGQARYASARTNNQTRPATIYSQAPPPQRHLAVAGNTYAAGNCTWYAKQQRPDMPNNLGNANTWYSRAAAQGFGVGYSPRVGAVAAAVGYSHVAIVRAVYGDGTILVSEMNYKGYGIVSSRRTSATEFRYIY